LRLERQRPSPRDAQDVPGGMQGRIRSMALLHEHLYQPGPLACVDLGACLRELARQAFHALETRPHDIGLEPGGSRFTVAFEREAATSQMA
jgi:two-component sensor histidine kinase